MALNKTSLFLLLALFITHNPPRVEAAWVEMAAPLDELMSGLTRCISSWLAVGESGEVWTACNQVLDRGTTFIPVHYVYTRHLRSKRSRMWRFVTPTLMPNSAIKQLSVGLKGVYGVDNLSGVYRFDGVRWINMPGLFRRIASGSSLWGLDLFGKVYRYTGSGEWKRVLPYSLKEISVSNFGDVWGITMEGQIVRRDGRRDVWQQIPGELVSIATGANGVWGVTPKGETVKYSPSGWTIMDRGLPGPEWAKLTQIDVGNWVVGVNGIGKLFVWSGPY